MEFFFGYGGRDGKSTQRQERMGEKSSVGKSMRLDVGNKGTFQRQEDGKHVYKQEHAKPLSKSVCTCACGSHG